MQEKAKSAGGSCLLSRPSSYALEFVATIELKKLFKLVCVIYQTSFLGFDSFVNFFAKIQYKRKPNRQTHLIIIDTYQITTLNGKTFQIGLCHSKNVY
jgi:hypothetical protein